VGFTVGIHRCIVRKRNGVSGASVSNVFLNGHGLAVSRGSGTGG
jgi:hypothetical protein